MRDPRINLKDPWLAALLAWLAPGLGHFYQGRTFKGTIYSVCILGLFLSGWAMADWSAVQPPDVRQPLADKTLLLKYTAQLGVGLPSLYGLVQSRRHHAPGNRAATTIDSSMDAEFEGSFLPLPPHVGWVDLNILRTDINVAQESMEDRGGHKIEWPLDGAVPASGRLRLSPSRTENGTPSIKGEFEGTIEGIPRKVKLVDVYLEEPIRSNPRRRVFAAVEDAQSGASLGTLIASVPRPFWDFLSVPMSPREENQLHERHGNYLEIWMVFTWIAGLLNMLAVWDAFDGPAYAYGDEEPSPDDKPDASDDAPGKATIIVNKAPAPA